MSFDLLRWRCYAAAALPLALAGVLPWWACGLLVVVFALGVRSQAHASLQAAEDGRWREARLLLSFLIVGGAILMHLAALGGVQAALRSGAVAQTLLLYLGLLLGSAALVWAAALLEEGQRRGLWVVLAVGLAAPQPLLVLALLGGAMMRPGKDDRRVIHWQGTRRMVTGSVLVVAALLVLTALFPRPPSWWAWTLTAAGPPAGSGQVALQPTASSAAESPARQAPFSPPADTAGSVGGWKVAGLPTPPSELLTVAGLLLVLALWTLLRIIPGRQNRPPTLTEWLMALSLLLTAALVLMLVLLGSSGGGAGGGLGTATPAGAPTAGRAVPTETEQGLAVWLSWILWGAVLFYLGLVGAVLWVAWQLRGGPPGNGQGGLTEGAAPADGPPQALHRVRAAYRQAEEVLSDCGRGRRAAETPAAYAARLSAEQAELSTALTSLSRVYAPVRYGGSVSLDDAQAAEDALRQIRRVVADLPPVVAAQEAE